MTTTLQPIGLIRSLFEGLSNVLSQLTSRNPQGPRRHLRAQTRVAQARHLPGLDRRSQPYRDAVGPGYVTGVTQSVIDLISEPHTGVRSREDWAISPVLRCRNATDGHLAPERRV